MLTKTRVSYAKHQDESTFKFSGVASLAFAGTTLFTTQAWQTVEVDRSIMKDVLLLCSHFAD